MFSSPGRSLRTPPPYLTTIAEVDDIQTPVHSLLIGLISSSSPSGLLYSSFYRVGDNDAEFSRYIVYQVIVVCWRGFSRSQGDTKRTQHPTPGRIHVFWGRSELKSTYDMLTINSSNTSQSLRPSTVRVRSKAQGGKLFSFRFICVTPTTLKAMQRFFLYYSHHSRSASASTAHYFNMEMALSWVVFEL